MKKLTKTVKKYIGIVHAFFKDILYDYLKRFIAWILLLCACIIIYLLQTGQLPSTYTNQRISKTITSKIGPKYSTRIQEANLSGYGDPSLIVIANDKRAEDPQICPGNLNTSPIIQIYDKRDKIFLDFSLPYKKIFDFQPMISENEQPWIDDYQIVDLDNDGKKEILIHMTATACGSGGTRYNLIFAYEDGSYKLKESLPAIAYTPNCGKAECINPDNLDTFTTEETIKNRVTGEMYDLYSSHTDNYINFDDVDKDGTYELIFAHPHRALEDECHFCGHTWLIGVYKYFNGHFVIDNKWNNGLLYITKEKIDLESALGYANIPNNIFGIMPQFLSNTDTFHFSGNPTSEIKRIVRKQYDNF